MHLYFYLLHLREKFFLRVIRAALVGLNWKFEYNSAESQLDEPSNQGYELELRAMAEQLMIDAFPEHWSPSFNIHKSI